MEGNIQLLAKRNEISDTMNRISSRFQQMQQYEAYQDKLETATLLKFAEWTVAPNAYSVHHLMDRLHLMMFGSDDKSLGSPNSNVLEMMANSYQVKRAAIIHHKTTKGKEIMNVPNVVLVVQDFFL